MNDIINDYALKYYAANSSIAPAGEFELTDTEYNEFVKYASSRDFDSRSAAQVELERMVKSAKNEDLYEMNKAEFEALSKKIDLPKKQLLQIKKEEIKPLIEEEIAQKFYFSRGRIESIIRNDSQLHKAIGISSESK